MHHPSAHHSSYDKFPTVDIPIADAAERGWADIGERLRGGIAAKQRRIVAVECYPGLHDAEVAGELRRGLDADLWLSTEEAFKTPAEIDRMLEPYLGGDDPIFGLMCPLGLGAFLDTEKSALLRRQAEESAGTVVVYGPGALLCVPNADLVVYADMPRWEGQLRQRRGEVSNLGADNQGQRASLLYKRSFFVDWRVCDRHKQDTLGRWDFLFDTTIPGDPKMVTGAALRAGLRQTARRPFRVVPFFDPAPWGGQWLKDVCDLDRAAPNYGWGFDCVPEENSLLLRFGDIIIEIPALNLVFWEPLALLGTAVYAQFGPEFPIRFDFLDTVQGGNLSLQVHPLAAYAKQQFGIGYTQDESYYILDAGPNASVFLGLKSGADPDALWAALAAAQAGEADFPAAEFVNQWPARAHDHFLIPAGTIHCSGAETVVLEISATPYIFTFKLWDWGRLGLDGLPRPINLRRGRESLRAERDTAWVQANLVSPVAPLGAGDGWREERTGLHELEFIETRRHWFTSAVPHDTHGTVQVLNLVAGAEAVVESPLGAFDPFVVHYAETFIVPAAVGPYTVRPHGPAAGTECATLKASARDTGPFC